jgi:hypothetical protein
VADDCALYIDPGREIERETEIASDKGTTALGMSAAASRLEACASSQYYFRYYYYYN